MRPRTWCFSALILLGSLGGCQFLYPEDDQVEPEATRSEKPLFEAEFYARNAAEYFDAGRYALAKDQWGYQIKLEPDNWLAKLGMASADQYLGRQALDRGDWKQSRELFESAEASIRELWDGTIEPDTLPTIELPVRQWQAALMLARTQRGAGDVDRMAALRLAQRELASDGQARSELAAERTKLEGQARENHRAAKELFARLANMKNMSEDAVINYAEMLAQSEDPGAAEPWFAQYLDIAQRTRTSRQELRKKIEAETANAEQKALSLQLLDESLKRNAEIQVGVYDRLGGLRYDAGRALKAQSLTGSVPPLRAKETQRRAATEFEAAIRHLENGRTLDPERVDLLVKRAQCEGELGRYREAIDHLTAYIDACSARNIPYNADLNRAYKLREEYEAQFKLQMAGS